MAHNLLTEFWSVPKTEKQTHTETHRQAMGRQRAGQQNTQRGGGWRHTERGWVETHREGVGGCGRHVYREGGRGPTLRCSAAGDGLLVKTHTRTLVVAHTHTRARTHRHDTHMTHT